MKDSLVTRLKDLKKSERDSFIREMKEAVLEDIESRFNELTKKLSLDYKDIKGTPSILKKEEVVKLIDEKIPKTPAVVEKTIKETVWVEYDDQPLKQELSDLHRKISDIKIPDIPKVDLGTFKEGIENEYRSFFTNYFGENFQKNIDIVWGQRMPDFRKMAMGLQSQIDEINANGGGGGGTWGSITGTLSNQTDLQTALNAKQDTLVSGTSIKTINGESLLGSGDIVISAGSGDVTGAASSDDNAIARFDGITGKIIKNSAVKILDTGQLVINASYTLPTADGTSNQVLMTNGGGDVTFQDLPSGGSPGGSDKGVQFNDGGSFGGSANFEWDNATQFLSVTGSTADGSTSVLRLFDSGAEEVFRVNTNGDVRLATGASVFWIDGAGASDVSITHSANTLTFTGASSGYSFDNDILFNADATHDIGTSTVGINDLHFGSGGIINMDGGDVTLTHSAANLTLGGDGQTNFIVNHGYAWLKRNGTGAGFYVTDTSLATNNSSWGINTDSSGNLIVARYNAGLSLLANSFQFLRNGNFNALEGSIIIPSTKGFYLDGGSNTFISESSADVIQFTTGGTARVQIDSQGVIPAADNTYYLGKNDDDTPRAWKGVILKDTTDGKYYRIEVISGVVTATDLTD